MISSRLGLALGVTVLALVALAVPGRAVSFQARPHSYSLDIRHRETASHLASVVSPQVDEVRRTVQRGLVQAGPEAVPADVIRETLASRYAVSSSANTTAMGYSWYWDPVLERWVIVCTSTSTYIIDFGASGSVIVQLDDRMQIY